MESQLEEVSLGGLAVLHGTFSCPLSLPLPCSFGLCILAVPLSLPSLSPSPLAAQSPQGGVWYPSVGGDCPRYQPVHEWVSRGAP